MHKEKVLLLNASNRSSFAVYPYAFIQVAAVARQSQIRVASRDLLGVPQDQWQPTIQKLIQRHRPAMILITLRNTDTLNTADYDPASEGAGEQQPYFPVERTRELIATVREICDLKVVMGGFGFSLLSTELMRYLRPDFGVFGGPDAFFEHFGDIQQGDVSGIANLLYFKGDQLVANPVQFFPPCQEPEYTPRAIEEMMAFYQSFPSPGFLGAPVEIMRGCNHSCVFCGEPVVAGHQVRYRDHSVVMQDIEMLVNHGINDIYMISSELNPEGNAFILELADRIHAFNEAQPEGKKVIWFGANYLLNFSYPEFERLYRSGFTGGWFDITALDDENARAMRTPYRNRSVLKDLRTYVHRSRKQLGLPPLDSANPVAEAKAVQSSGNPKESVRWTMFLGNPATSLETIRRTLEVADLEGLSSSFHDCHVNTHIRVFEYEAPAEATLAVTYSVTEGLQRTRYQQLLPSFAYPPALLSALGSEAATATLFDHIGETYLSTRYRRTRRWREFLRQHAEIGSAADWLAVLPAQPQVAEMAYHDPGGERMTPVTWQELFLEQKSGDENDGLELAAEYFAETLLAAALSQFRHIFDSLDLPLSLEALGQMTPYRLATLIYSRWSSEEDFVEASVKAVRPEMGPAAQELLRFCLKAILYRFNVLLRPDYRALFVSGDAKAARAAEGQDDSG